MSKQVKPVKETKVDERLEIMSSNNMLYDCEENLSCVIQKEFKQNRFISPDVENYKEGYQLMCNFDTLTDDEYFIGTNSYIHLSVNVRSDNEGFTDNFGWGSNYNNNALYPPLLDPQAYKSYFNTGGSVLNLFHRVELLTPAGQIIFSENFFNETRTARQYEISQERMDTINAMTGGLCYDKKAQQYLYPVFATNCNINFTVPLSEISPYFNQSKPLPSSVLKDCILRITLDKPDKCIYLYKFGGDPSFNIGFDNGFAIDVKKVHMNYQTVKVFDSINKIVKNNSIQIPYKTKYTVRKQINSSSCEFTLPLTAANVFNVQLKFIRSDYNFFDSQAFNDQGVAIYNTNQRSPIYANDFNELIDFPAPDEEGIIPSLKIRVGDYYYPQFNPSTVQDYYIMTNEALNNISGASCNDVDPKMTYNKASIGCVNYTDYSFSTANYVPSSQPAQDFLSTGGCIMAFDLRRNKDMGLSGITTNSQRKLTVLMSGIRAIDRNSKFDVYITVEYLQILEYKDGKITVMK